MRILLIAVISLLTLCASNVKAQNMLAIQPNPPCLVSFAAAKNTSSAIISWKVKNEPDGSTFGVEKSTDNGKTFQLICTILPNGSETYGFADNRPATGQNQYRLKMQDSHGNSSYSNPLILVFQSINFASNKIEVTSNDDDLDMSPVSKQIAPRASD